MFLKRKRSSRGDDGRIKGRGCGDGRRQREFISKEEASSPTLSMSALMAMCLVEAIEGRKVITADIPGAFLQIDYPDSEAPLFLRFEGVMVGMLIEIDPSLKEFIFETRRGKLVLFTQCTKCIYGSLKSVLLFYQHLTGKLSNWDFTVNPYDPCTWNTVTAKGEQLTVQVFVDDVKTSSVDAEALAMFFGKLQDEFGTSDQPLVCHTGTVHEYLGMRLDYSIPGRIILTMFDYLESVLNECPDDKQFLNLACTPATDTLFHLRGEAPSLDDVTAELFFRLVARLLYVSKRARPDLQLAVAFLCTRVKAPDIDDWRKLGRVFKYIRNTISIPLILGWDGSGKIYWSDDAAFAVHADMRSHSGCVMSLGQGALLSQSNKQKLNTKSSTEAEIVGADDSMGLNIWSRNFFLHQGLSLPDDAPSKPIGKENLLSQDNTSAIRMENFGKQSCTKRTSHISIIYFYITDKVKSGEVEVVYYPSSELVADYLTKPLQGSLFRKMRNSLMGVTEEIIARFATLYASTRGQGSLH